MIAKTKGSKKGQQAIRKHPTGLVRHAKNKNRKKEIQKRNVILNVSSRGQAEWQKGSISSSINSSSSNSRRVIAPFLAGQLFLLWFAFLREIMLSCACWLFFSSLRCCLRGCCGLCWFAEICLWFWSWHSACVLALYIRILCPVCVCLCVCFFTIHSQASCSSCADRFAFCLGLIISPIVRG